MSFIISRRKMVKGMAAGMPLAAVLADPVLARAAARSLEGVTMTTSGGQTVNGFVATPARTPAPGIMLIHEWWGLNDQIKSVTAELGRQGYLALAIDLYDTWVTNKPEEARRLVESLDPSKATDTVMSWAQALKNQPKSTGKIGTVGWCFGGGWSLNTSIATPVDATVVYYGKVDRPPQQLARLSGPVLGHFATNDQWITKEIVTTFEKGMTEAGKPYTVHWYEANHGFANPTDGNYDAKDARLAWSRTLEFFKENLRGG